MTDSKSEFDDYVTPEIKERVRQALNTAKDKAIHAGLPFDDATAIIIAQEMLARAAKAYSVNSPGGEEREREREKLKEKSEKLGETNKQPETVKYMIAQTAKSPPKDADPEQVQRDMMKLAMISAKKKAHEAGEEFDENIFIAVYERKRKHQLAKVNREKSSKATTQLTAPAIENNSELEAVLREQAKVAARAARAQASVSGEYFDEVDFTVRFIINRRKEISAHSNASGPMSRNK
eukprot:CAMPEP_0182438052 /NCGR_PEP_ID=MMETSP1167-20130531/85476_1 /TAXON_ID=2988 /ORGANISM="Mallomonas Sp, Strain CCMP3275" /LENGTH=235 /DNA_ID=CAMNT_0024631217 /DNA_START=942 /DNA_END=1649 /DNA_ORIENTATION=-